MHQRRLGIKKAGILTFFLSLWLLTFVFPGVAAEKGSQKPLKVYVVNYPLKYFAERIGGESVQVHFPAPPDVDPAYWIPDTNAIGQYQQSDLILLNGAGYAKWVKKVSLPRSKLVNTSISFKDRIITSKEVVTHSHGLKGEHAHEGAAFTTWIDFDQAAKQAVSVAGAFSRKRPNQAKIFQRNAASLTKDLRAIDQKILTIVNGRQDQPLVVSHPVYDYFSRRYQLNIKSVHWEPDQTPDRKQQAELVALLKDHSAKWMIWEGEPVEAAVKRLRDMGLQSLVFAPSGNVPRQGDFLSVMRQNVVNLMQAFPSN